MPGAVARDFLKTKKSEVRGGRSPASMTTLNYRVSPAHQASFFTRCAAGCGTERHRFRIPIDRWHWKCAGRGAIGGLGRMRLERRGALGGLPVPLLSCRHREMILDAKGVGCGLTKGQRPTQSLT